MKKWLLVVLLLLSSFTVAQTDKTQLTESVKPLLAAINAAAKTGFDADRPNYLPGYGVAYIAVLCDNSKTRWADVFQVIKGFTTALGQTVKGLDADDWFSLTVNFVCDREAGNPSFVVRQKGVDFGKADKWEVWVNGKKQ